MSIAGKIGATPQTLLTWVRQHERDMGCIESGKVERMLILTDIEALMSSAEMGLADATRY